MPIEASEKLPRGPPSEHSIGSAGFGIASRLFISAKTADHHIQHIYTKIGTSSRAAAAVFAMEHDLLDGHPR